jgi:hypothetical protein
MPGKQRVFDAKTPHSVTESRGLSVTIEEGWTAQGRLRHPRLSRLAGEVTAAGC